MTFKEAFNHDLEMDRLGRNDEQILCKTGCGLPDQITPEAIKTLKANADRLKAEGWK